MAHSPILIEGLIGAGKSTLVSALQKAAAADRQGALDLASFHLEPVDRYASFKTSDASFDPLKLLYEGKDEDKFAVQLHICQQSYQYYASRLSNSYHSSNRVGVFERSIYSNVTFIKTYKRLGFLTDFSASYLLEIVKQHLDRTFNCFPGLIIYLDISVELALKRIVQRDRTGEHAISAKFLEILKQEQLKQLSQFRRQKIRGSRNPTTIITLKVDEDTTLEELVKRCSVIIKSYCRFRSTELALMRSEYEFQRRLDQRKAMKRRRSLPQNFSDKLYWDVLRPVAVGSLIP